MKYSRFVLPVVAALFALTLLHVPQSAVAQEVEEQSYSCGEICDPAELGLDADQLEKIDSTCIQWIENEDIAGCSAMVIRDGKIGYFKCFGHRDRAEELPVERDTIFRIYSMSKPVTSVAVMQLVEQGKIGLDDPVSKFIEGFGDLTVLKTQGDDVEEIPARREITVRDLLSHTSGLTYGFFGDTAVDMEYRRQGVLMMDDNLEHMCSKLSTIPLLYQPGERWHYSVASDVLGRVVEVASEQMLDEYFQQHIFEPLGMTDSFFSLPADRLPRLAEMYSPGLEPAAAWESFRIRNAENKFFSGGGGLCSTIDDYGRFAQMLTNRGELDGVRILQPETVDSMYTNQLEELDNPGGSFKFGLGFRISDRGDNGTDYGWGGAAGTRFWANPDRNLSVLFMVQIKPTPQRFGERILNLTYQAIEE
ncbi:MAG: serine hydrolase domain-containing protein [Planctomycetota bacterium]